MIYLDDCLTPDELAEATREQRALDRERETVEMLLDLMRPGWRDIVPVF